MIKNLIAAALFLATLAAFAKLASDADLREEAWKCDRLVRQGYPTGGYCKAVWADVARLDGK